MENKKHICKYCGKEFETGKKLGGHIVACKLNPKSKETAQKIGQAKTNSAKFNIYDIQCPICGKYKQIKISLHSYEKGNYMKTCGGVCAHKFANQNTNLTEKNKKISNTIKIFAQNCTDEQFYKAFRHHRKKDIIIHICKYCRKEFNQKDRGKSKFCSDECMKASRHEKLSNSAKRNHFGGLNPETTHKHYHRGYYNNIWCDSSWELAFLVFNIENGKNIKRYDGIPLEYDYKGVKRKYYPDFQIDNELYEIKGKFYDNNYYKMKAYPNIHIISKEEIKQYTKYVSEKYGNKYWEVLYN